MAFTLSRNLRLRLDSNLTANSRYNLERIDLLGSTFLTDSTNTLNIRSETDIRIEPESPDVGGSGTGGSVTIGSPDHLVTSFSVYASSLLLSAPLSLLDQATGGTRYLNLRYKSDLNGSVDTTSNRVLSFDLDGADRSLIMAGNLSFLGGPITLTTPSSSSLTLPTTGTLATLAGSETLTNKSIDALSNTVTNLANASIAAGAGISYSKLNLLGSIVNADVSSSAAIAYSKLNLSGSVVNSDIATTAAIARSKIASGAASHVLINDGSGDLSSEAQLAISRGGTGAATANTALNNLLPSQTGQSLKVLQTDGSNTSWVAVGTGSVSSIALSMPTDIFDVSGSPITTSGTLSVTLDTQTANQIWAGPTTGSPATPSFRSLVVADIPTGVDHGGLAGLGDDDHTQYHTDSRALTWLGTRSTGDLPEGSNLYFTDERVDDRVAALIQNGTGVSWSYNDPAGTLTPTVTLTPFSTTNLAEGSNLYFTDERAQDAVGAALTDTASVDLTYNDGANTITAVVLPAGVDHDQLLNFVANKHVDHSSVQIATAATSGLSGGGDLTDTRNLVVAPTQATAASPAAADTILFADASASDALRKATIQEVLDLGGGKFTATWATADGATKAVTHNFGVNTVSVNVYDENGEDILVDTIDRTSTNVVTLTASTAPTGDWTVIIRK